MSASLSVFEDFEAAERHNEGIPDTRLRGMNPNFVKAIWKKRRRQQQEMAHKLKLIEKETAATRERELKAALLSKTPLDAAFLEATKEEYFAAEFNDAITRLRLAHIADIHKDDAARRNFLEKMEARYKAFEIKRHHIEHSAYTLAEFDGKGRAHDLVTVRDKAIADVYVLCPHLSLPQIGKMFGGRDHTSILYVVQKLGVHRGGLPSKYQRKAKPGIA